MITSFLVVFEKVGAVFFLEIRCIQPFLPVADGVSQPLVRSYHRVLPLAHMRLDGIQLSSYTREVPQGLGIGRAVLSTVF